MHVFLFLFAISSPLSIIQLPSCQAQAFNHLTHCTVQHRVSPTASIHVLTAILCLCMLPVLPGAKQEPRKLLITCLIER